MKKMDYDNEIYNQLEDLNTYHPSTPSHFSFAMEDFKDKLKVWERSLSENKNISSSLPTNYGPSKFYVLPKVHKKFENFPIGRPISSTCATINRGASKLLDMFLQPIMNTIPDLILDSTHLLLLLDNLKLDPYRKYTLVTIDIVSLYTNLPTSVCKLHCTKYFNRYKHELEFPFNITNIQLENLMSLALDFSFVEYEGNYFVQHKGIQMGNSASVSIANITVHEELKPMFYNRTEIMFNKRFLDDLILIVDSTDIVDMSSYLNNMCSHRFLEFTHEHSERSINYLDVKIDIMESNTIQTSLYQKPMSRHQFLHFMSNHPIHLKNSLMYSQGLRIIRTCSSENDKQKELYNLANKFRTRMYPEKTIIQTLNVLESISRESVLKPKRKLLINNLSMNNPDILVKYNIDGSTQSHNKSNTHENTYFVVIPFYKSVYNLGSIVINYLTKQLCKCNDNIYKPFINSLKLKIAYSKPNSLQQYTRYK